MSIRADSYSSTSEVKTFSRHLLDGADAWNFDTRPTLTEVEKFIDRASAYLNGALAGGGFAPSAIRANTTAKLACDDWVTSRVVEHVELTKRGVGYSEQDGQRVYGFRNMQKAAGAFVDEMKLGWIRLGVSVSHSLSEGLQFTGETVQDDRTDPDDETLEQPLFGRKQWNNPEAT